MSAEQTKGGPLCGEQAGICEAKMDEFGKITLKMFDGSHIPQQETQDEFK